MNPATNHYHRLPITSDCVGTQQTLSGLPVVNYERSMRNALSLLKTGFRFIKTAYSHAWRLARHPREGLKSLYGVSLYRNAGYLMIGTAVTSATGFVFWIIAARFYPVEAVGLGSAIISAMGLLALLSNLGLGIGLIRFLPGAGRDGNDMMNSFFTVGGLASIAIALIFLAGLHLWSPALLSVRQHPIFFTAFVVFAGATALQPLVNDVFLAKLNTRLIVIKSIIFGALRIALLPVLAVFFASAFGIFAAKGLAVAVALLIAGFCFLPRVQDGYRPCPKIERRILTDVVGYAGGNYIGRLLWQIPPLVLPLVVLNLLGAEMNAYFYIGWTIAMALKAIPSAIFNSLFAEGSNDEASIRTNIAKSLKLLFVLLLPVIALVFIVAEGLLLLFGPEYADNAALLLRIVAIAVIPWGINYLSITLERVRKNIKGIITLTGVVTSLSLGLSCLLMLQMGLIGVGLGYAAGQTIVASAVTIHYWRRYHPSIKP